MVCLLVVGVLVMVAGGGAENMTLEGSFTVEPTGFKLVAEFCGNLGGLDANETFIFLWYPTDESFKSQCSNISQHQPAWECMKNIVTSLSNDSAQFIQFPFGMQIFSVLDVLCKDSSIKPECIADYTQQQEALETCITSRNKNIDAQIKVGHLRDCLHIQALSKCSTDVISKCDVYTGSIIEEQFKSFMPLDCDFSIIFG